MDTTSNCISCIVKCFCVYYGCKGKNREGHLLPAVSKFTNESGARYTKSLFYETTLADKSTVVYSLKDEDHKGFPSLYKLYMAEMDPTEYRFANKHLQDWQHWCILCELSWFKPYVERWRQELDLKIRAEALSRILNEANSDRRESLSANKYLLEKGWVTTSKDKVGRPSKEKIRSEAERLFKTHSRPANDLTRLGINIINE